MLVLAALVALEEQVVPVEATARPAHQATQAQQATQAVTATTLTVQVALVVLVVLPAVQPVSTCVAVPLSHLQITAPFKEERHNAIHDTRN